MAFDGFKKKAEELAKKAKEKVIESTDIVGSYMPDDIAKLGEKTKEAMVNASEAIRDSVPEKISDKANKIATHAQKTAIDSIGNASDKYLDSKLDEIESYCSWCFEKHGCTLKEKNDFSRNVYTCNGCKKEIIKCRACDNKAKYSAENNDEVGLWSGNFCAVHEGTIAKFETLNWKLSTIGEYRDIVERKDMNYKKIGTTAAYSIGGAAVIAPLALAAAPAVGGAIGTSLLGLSGAAATNAGLATLGGGALAAGGAGMAGGVAVVTAAGSALGGRYGAVISNSYFGDIDGFEIIKIKPGKEPSIICIDGFLTEKDKDAPKIWLDGLSEHYPENTIYYVRWESKRLRDLANSISLVSGKEVAKKGLLAFAKSASKAAATKIAPLGAAFQALNLATNPWSVASVKAYQTGALLADIIARTDKEYILIGHSLGARVIYSCLAALKTKNECFIKEVYLLGGAVDKNCATNESCDDQTNWSDIHKSVSGSIHNYYSKNDSVLKYLYKVGESVKFDFGDPIGRYEIDSSDIDNIDVSEYIDGHTKYKSKIHFLLNI